jgi:hypothetical protein
MLLDGTVHPDFGGLTPLLSKYLTADGHFGGALCIYHRGEKVVDVWGGRRDEQGAQWAHDTMPRCVGTISTSVSGRRTRSMT